jgi:hypothetical protein
MNDDAVERSPFRAEAKRFRDERDHHRRPKIPLY